MLLIRCGMQEKELTAREKKASKDLASAARQVDENVKKTAELARLEAEVCDGNSQERKHGSTKFNENV
eukprot:scaffold113628_cov14-Tisochrysis_lutea.AAC.1